MQEKDIKRLVLKQLKKRFPNWRRLTRKEKKRLAQQVLDEVVAGYTGEYLAAVSLNELTNTPVPPADLIGLSEMEKFIKESTRCLLRLPSSHWQKHFADAELQLIDDLLDDRVLHRLVVPDHFTGSMRDVYPHHYVRAEVLKALRYPEFSYRKYCAEVINRLDNKRERAFIHLPLHKQVQIDHSQLSRFRGSLTLSQQINLMVYVIYLLIKNGKIGHPFQVCGVDSSELAVACRPYPVAKLKIGQKMVRIYAELDADCGKRRKKRDKSEYFVGYRLHTLVAIDPATGHNYPLLTLAAPGNHHDNLFLTQLLGFGQAMGLGVQVITADEGYTDADQNEQIRKDYEVTVITPASAKVNLPEHVDPQSHAVYMNGNCEVPMAYAGRTETGHEFRCAVNAPECFHAPTCLRSREMELDSGLFGQIPDQVDGVEQVRGLRKNMERAYNLLKHREGLEPLRVRSQHAAMSAATFAQMATLLLEITDTRRTPQEQEAVPKQLSFAA